MTVTGTAVRGPGPVLVPGGGTAGLALVPAEEKNLESHLGNRLNTYYFRYN